KHLREERYVSQADLFPILLTELEKAEPLRLRGGIMREMGGRVDRQYASRVGTVAAKTLDECLEDKTEWPPRMYSVRLIGEAGYAGAMEQVAKCVGDDIANVRQAAGRALDQLAPLCSDEERAKVAPILQPLLTNPVDWRKTAIAAGAIGGYAVEENIEPLSLLLSHSVLNCRTGASKSLVTIARNNKELRDAVEKAVYAELGKNRNAWEYGAPILGALKDPKAIEQLTTILEDGNWHAQAAAARAVTEIAMANKISNKPLSNALIKAGQSEVLQVQEACDTALRALTKAS
ncbi:MAG: HEAT repeat domain-containing protein, partial [Pirellulales bacterium]|nr:HEAT repeat domain-containing protein [Pirellulales bacterium]